MIYLKTDMEKMPKCCDDCVIHGCHVQEESFNCLCPLRDMPTREEAREILITMKDDNSTTMNISNDIVEISDGIERALDKLGYPKEGK